MRSIRNGGLAFRVAVVQTFVIRVLAYLGGQALHPVLGHHSNPKHHRRQEYDVDGLHHSTIPVCGFPFPHGQCNAYRPGPDDVQAVNFGSKATRVAKGMVYRSEFRFPTSVSDFTTATLWTSIVLAEPPTEQRSLRPAQQNFRFNRQLWSHMDKTRWV